MLRQILKIVLVTSSVWFCITISAVATEVSPQQVEDQSAMRATTRNGNAKALRDSRSIREIPRLAELERPSTSAQQLVQTPAPSNTSSKIVQVTGVKANPTDKGVEIILQTLQGQQLQLVNRSAGNSFITDIPNAQLRLPSGEAYTFRSDKPIAGVTEITVTNFDAQTIRVAVTGEANAPVVELYDSPDEGLIFSVASPASSTPQAQQPQTQQPQPEQPSNEDDEPIELVVTGEQDGYSVPDASTATRTDTALRDIPQSIQVVPRQVLEDQQVIRPSEALRNVSGVQRGLTGANTGDSFIIRGFAQSDTGSILRDGFRVNSFTSVETANLERIEVLKGPASVLYGNLEPGGAINYVTKQPLSEPFYLLGLQAGSFGLIRPTLDLSGPLNPERTLLYRLNAVYEKGGYFRDFDQEPERFFVSPVLTWKVGDRTKLTLEFQYLNDERPRDRGLIAVGRGVADIPFDRILGEPDDVNKYTQFTTGYRLEHSFSENLTLRNQFLFYSSDRTYSATEPGRLNEITGVLNRTFFDVTTNERQYTLQTDLTGKFTTGSVKHTLLFGVDLSRELRDQDVRSAPASSINIFNPIYGTVPRPSRDQYLTTSLSQIETNSLGVFLQDQIALTENFKLLIGGRFDILDQKSTSDGEETQQQDNAFSPRIGIVYQPIQPISLYTSFSKSFQPNSGRLEDDSLPEPQRGTQYEVGIRGEFFDSKLTTNLAAYEITKSNVASQVDERNFVTLVGEQRSRGIELDVAGEILPGWNIIANYAYTDAKVTQDNLISEGNLLNSVPFNSASLWSTYEIQTGNLRGLGFGLGLFYVGERQGDLENSFDLGSYVRTDSSIFYRRNNLKLGLNFKNLFNVDYIETSQRRNRVDPGAPFTVIGTLSVEF